MAAPVHRVGARERKRVGKRVPPRVSIKKAKARSLPVCGIKRDFIKGMTMPENFKKKSRRKTEKKRGTEKGIKRVSPRKNKHPISS
jgi:hypothetical protein